MAKNKIQPSPMEELPAVSNVVRRWHVQKVELFELDEDPEDKKEELETNHKFTLAYHLDAEFLGIMLELNSTVQVSENASVKLALEIEFEFHFDQTPTLTAALLEAYIKYNCLPFATGFLRSKAHDMLSDFGIKDYLLPYFLEASLQEEDMSEYITGLLANLDEVDTSQ